MKLELSANEATKAWEKYFGGHLEAGTSLTRDENNLNVEHARRRYIMEFTSEDAASSFKQELQKSGFSEGE